MMKGGGGGVKALGCPPAVRTKQKNVDRLSPRWFTNQSPPHSSTTGAPFLVNVCAGCKKLPHPSPPHTPRSAHNISNIWHKSFLLQPPPPPAAYPTQHPPPPLFLENPNRSTKIIHNQQNVPLMCCCCCCWGAARNADVLHHM